MVCECAHAVQVDNVLWGGKVADNAVQDEDTKAIRELNAKIVKDDRCLLCCSLMVEFSSAPYATTYMARRLTCIGWLQG